MYPSQIGIRASLPLQSWPSAVGLTEDALIFQYTPRKTQQARISIPVSIACILSPLEVMPASRQPAPYTPRTPAPVAGAISDEMPAPVESHLPGSKRNGLRVARRHAVCHDGARRSQARSDDHARSLAPGVCER